MNTLLRYLFYRVFVRFIVLIALGLNVRHREKLPTQGPAILVANHNSHLDTMVLINLLPAQLLPSIQPVAAMDYFLRNPVMAWFALKIIGILPMKRKPSKRGDNPLQPCFNALDNNKILIFFPEGSRGQPEQLSEFKGGINKVAEAYPEVPIIPIMLHGLGKSLPKGEALFVPFFCDVFIGDPLYWTGDKQSFKQQLQNSMQALAEQGQFFDWK